jgi:uncharacterized protein (TIGR02444 family)
LKLWDYALAAWERPGVSQTCLELQDREGQCVALLLWAAWALTQGRPVGAMVIAQAVDLARTWEVGVIAPLRATRRALAKLEPGGAARAAARTAELAAERSLLEALDSMTPPPSAACDNPAAALAAVMENWSGSGARGDADRLWDVLR